MRIIQLAPYYPPYMGGQEMYIAQLARFLALRGHEVSTLTANYPRSARREIKDGVRIKRFACWGRPLRNPLVPGLVFQRFRRQEIDLFHAHNLYSFSTLVSVLFRKWYRVPLVITSHGRLDFGTTIPNLLVRGYSRTLGRIILHNADRIIVLSETEKDRLAAGSKVLKDKIVVIPGGIDLEQWDARNARLDAGGKGMLFPDRQVILVATQLIRRKGIGFLISAMPALLEHTPGLLLAIAGGGSDEGLLRQQVQNLGLQEQVRFLGVLGGDELARAYRSADIFVLPSVGEGQPMCILEAWAFSKPVVATKIEGVTDYYHDAAILVEPASSIALQEAIIRLLEDADLRRDYGLRGRSLAEQFKLDLMVGRIEEIYRMLALQKGASGSSTGESLGEGK